MKQDLVLSALRAASPASRVAPRPLARFSLAVACALAAAAVMALCASAESRDAAYELLAALGAPLG